MRARAGAPGGPPYRSAWTATAIANSRLGVLTGDWWPEAGVLGPATLTMGATVAGLAALFGRAGIDLGALLIVFLGNPFSGASPAPRMPPEPVGTPGHRLPPGAGASLLRSVSYSDGAAALGPALVLTWWAAFGLAAVILGRAQALREAHGDDHRADPGSGALSRTRAPPH